MSKQKSKFAAVLATKRTAEPEAAEDRQAKLRGKRTHPDYRQVTAYIPRALHQEVKIALIQEPDHDFSTLVESLLAQWVSKKGKAGS
jgi:hypothetical protein